MIKFWVITFWFMKVAQKVVTKNFIIELTGDTYFTICQQICQIFDPFPLKIVDVLNGRFLIMKPPAT